MVLMTAAELAMLLGTSLLNLFVRLAGTVFSLGASALLNTLTMIGAPLLLAYLAGNILRQWKPDISNGERLAGVFLNLAACVVLFVVLATERQAMAEIVLFLLPAAVMVGHITPILDPDGAIRQVPALICHENKTYAALPLAGLIAASAGDRVRLSPGRSLLDPAWWLSVGEQRLPLDQQGRFRVSYQMPRAGFLAVSAVDVLNGQVPKGLLDGAWVLVGSPVFKTGVGR